MPVPRVKAQFETDTPGRARALADIAEVEVSARGATRRKIVTEGNTLLVDCLLPDKVSGKALYNWAWARLSAPQIFGKVTFHMCSHEDQDVFPCNTVEAEYEETVR